MGEWKLSGELQHLASLAPPLAPPHPRDRSIAHVRRGTCMARAPLWSHKFLYKFLRGYYRKYYRKSSGARSTFQLLRGGEQREVCDRH